MADNLKPCPFCGGKAEVQERGTVEGQSMAYCCTCEICGASVEGLDWIGGDGPPGFERQDRAVEAWNWRASIGAEVANMFPVADGTPSPFLWPWRPISELQEGDGHFGLLVHSEKLVHADFNPDGVSEATPYWNDGGETVEFVCAVWNNTLDSWNAVDLKRADVDFWMPKPKVPLVTETVEADGGLSATLQLLPGSEVFIMPVTQPRTIDALFARLEKLAGQYVRRKGLAGELLDTLLEWRKGEQARLDAMTGYVPPADGGE